MKKSIITILAILMALVFAMPAFSAISTPVVRVNLTKTVVFTKEQVTAKVAEYSEVYGEMDEATVLDAMISDELLAQGMARDGFVLTDEQSDQLLAYYRSNIESSFGQTLTDDQFSYVISQYYGMTVETYREYISQQYLVQSYVTSMKAEMFTEETLLPSTAEIETFYKRNRSTFLSSENVKLSHVFFNFGDGQESKAKAVASDIASGKITFEKAVTQYSEDTDSVSSAGEIGWLSIDDTDTMAYMGENFFDKVFELDAGEVSGVIQSLAGYHIVKVTVHNDARILDIDDRLSPADTATVRDYIEQYLYETNLNSVFQSAYLALISDLKAEATIKYL